MVIVMLALFDLFIINQDTETNISVMMSSDNENTKITNVNTAYSDYNITDKKLRPSISPNCIATDKEISFSSEWNDPKTKLIRSTILRHGIPPLLISYGGSGNTFTRLLIEYTTKIYTGSVYGDEFSEDLGFYGSKYCLTEVITVKFHGEHLVMDYTIKPLVNNPCLCGCARRYIHAKWIKKPPKNATINKFKEMDNPINTGAIILIRNPWDSLFALYQYKKGDMLSDEKNRHQNHRNLSTFNLKGFKKFLKKDINSWINNVKIYQMLKQQNASVIMVKFENLISSEIDIRNAELLKIIKYLYNDTYYEKNEMIFKQRIDCLWKLMKTDDRMEGIHRTKATSLQLNKTYAYQSLNEEFLCQSWRKLQPYAIQFGYTSYQRMPC